MDNQKQREKITRRTFLKYGTALGVGGLTFGNWGTVRGQTTRPIVIGITSDASGNFAESGGAERRGIIMAIEEFN